MSYAPPARPPAARRRGALGPTLVVLAVLVVVLIVTAQLWSEVLWFDAVGYVSVLRTQWLTRAALFAVGFLVMAGSVHLALRLAYSSRPVYAPATAEQVSLDQYREMVEPLRRALIWVLPGVLGLFAGGAASGQWDTVLLAMNSVEFGQVDPEFGLDLSFYVFVLPALRAAVSFLMTVVVISLIATVATQYLYGGLRFGGPDKVTMTRAARMQIGLGGAAIMLAIAANHWLDRYTLLTTAGELIDGASYADINAVIPAKAILAGVAVLVAILFVVAAFRNTWRLPVIGVALMVITAIVIGGIYPAVVQRFQVQPNEQELEAEYIQRNIAATREAFDIDDVEVTAYNANLEPEAGALRADAETTASIRLLDPAIISPSFRQLQQNKQYYDFRPTLSVDRYQIAGESRDTVIAVRELNLAGLGTDQRSWVNDHTVFTHGFGVVAAFGNTTAPGGRPAFFEGGIPSTGELGEYEPRIYFGESLPAYSIVGAPEGTPGWELDYPDDSAGGQVNTTFPTDEITAGPGIDSLWRKTMYALKFGAEEILFSERVNEESQVMYYRDPAERVAKVAPYLTLDSTVYPAVVDGRVLWVVDGYTTSAQYPYSASRQLEELTVDALTAQSVDMAMLVPQEINYLRNSVKATVDAYTGEVTLYAWDTEDPVLQAWTSVFPATVEPVSEISGDLMSHLRYPEDMFKVQRNLLATYHVETAAEYYSGQDFWKNPQDPIRESQPQPPYYLTLQMPTQDEPTFSLTSSFIPGGNTDRNVLTGFLAVNAEPGSEPGVIHEDYGQLRLLELPRDSTVPGPGQVKNKFNADPAVSTELNLLRQGNSTVVSGNLLTLPVGGGLLYVQPVYVQSSEGTQFPLLQRVLVSFGEEIGFAPTLQGALDQVFGGDAGVPEPELPEVDVPDQPAEGEPPVVEPTPPTDEPTAEPTAEPTSEPTAEPTEPTTPDGDPRARLDAALQDAAAAMTDSRTALQAGDFAAYGEAQDRLQDALERAIAAEAELG